MLLSSCLSGGTFNLKLMNHHVLVPTILAITIALENILRGFVLLHGISI